MKELKRDLKILQKGLSTLSDKVDKIVEGLEKLEKAPVAGKKGRVAGKKEPVAKKKGRASRKESEKKVVKGSAAQKVLGIIEGNGKGVDTATLKEKTGFDQRKIWSIINSLKKQGKVKSQEKGVYVKA
jgi:X-X-X-Leu-X-X-Gly heptad repeat protein